LRENHRKESDNKGCLHQIFKKEDFQTDRLEQMARKILNKKDEVTSMWE